MIPLICHFLNIGEKPQYGGGEIAPQNQDYINYVEGLRLKCHSLFDSSLPEWERQSKEYYAAKQEFVSIMGNSSVTYNNPVKYISAK